MKINKTKFLNYLFFLKVYSDINQMQTYLKQTLTPIVEFVFNENRSIRNLFSAIDYAPVKKVTKKILFFFFFI